MKPIKLFWSRGSGRDDAGKQNFGDYLSALTVEFVSGRKVVHSPVKEAEMIAIGSILAREKKARTWGVRRKLHVWGTGSSTPGDVFSGHHHYHAVRGRKCLEQIKGLKGQPVLGDPGLLASSLVKKPALKTIRVGIIPHINHRNSPEIASLLSLIPGSRVIDVFSPVKQVLEEIASCEFVLSTSLHGLIVADSYGVPNQWLCMKRYPQWEFKFQDYYSSFGIADPVPVTPEQIHLDKAWSIERSTEGYARPGLESLQEGLVKAFPSL
ncbi:Polysaccharide pyruvyl transferase [Pseudomonas guariconensis]|uniref:polysaccharide pyruvyl transferase family protein n=1 Tax=Pseudomonas guariconensis TaxID=1288410 RepID=UPI00088CF625|nr:polysaccharide pyruvyl transferase family protein [Pseudomonas guariconensis]SDD78079.1 Polysaccharide pyruvyl transferase [Pseudomonas guariconensis]